MISIVLLSIGDDIRVASIQRQRGDTYATRFYDNRATVTRLTRAFEGATPSFQSEAQGNYTFKIYEFADAKGDADNGTN